MAENSERSLEDMKQELWELIRARIKDQVEEFEEGIQTLQKSINFYKTSMEGMDKWLLATLVAINGGAVITLFNATEGKIEPLRWPLTVFVIGVILAVMSGLMQLGIWSAIVTLRDRSDELRQFAHKLIIEEDHRKVPKKFLNKNLKFPGRIMVVGLVVRAIIGAVFFYGSLGCFIYGAYCVGTSF